ncbi:HTH-type transcriptional regulatory protein GabR [Janthinobacterium sp. HH103]|uniref:MocR-like pyridoxine biosynthesis transcription factor PdxR n=1 Tax=unclassified Janthinobacterium TaxID=2610881 RepID=UPI000873D7E3|nr:MULTISPECIES: PLP-dependent aminotransferase family protein [unclassified Janthinobacterium]OEZ66145.1 HTH-type transcriptional regulatory protein GabR [Janthinobacterium sp. HH100]OEZ87076.1 HTH-type transcriptional regulatory protein GabR [Janthinobacterium sp. HH103]QOU73042.1 HTH-type transcriptional regulatory protein GabR [Janthinobacterium sp. HH102]
MTPQFELDTLKIRIAAPGLAALDLRVRVQRALRQLILDGVLAPGVRLPATRTLAQSLGVSRDTVEMAYAQLRLDGYLRRQAGSGSFVSPTIGASLLGKPATTLPSLSAQPMALSARGAQILASGGVADQQSVKAFATGLPETRAFPLDVWERLRRQAAGEHHAGMLLHGDPQGAEPLRQAIADYVNLERGARATAGQVLVLSSTRQALYLCAQVLADAHGPILMEDPGYFGARKAFEMAQLQIVPVPVDAHGLSIDHLRADRSGASTIYVTPSHQYPTGATLALERRLALTAWAAERQGWIIEDDYDSQFHYAGLPTACVQGLDAQQRTIYLGTFAKSLYPGLRIGYMVLPPALVKPMTYARSILDGHTPQLDQLTLARFIADGHFAAHVRAMRKVYAVRRDAMAQAVQRHLPHVVTAQLPPGGLQMPCLLHEGRDELDTLRLAAQAGIVLPGLSRLYATPPERGGWLLGFAALTPHEIDSGIVRLARALG